MSKFWDKAAKIYKHVNPFLGAGIEILGGAISNKQNERLAKEERDWELEMWNKQNAYNHPQAQMARLEEAGLNPRMIYGSGAATAAGTAGDVGGYTRSQSQNVTQGIDVMSNFYNFKNLQAQTENTQANTEIAKQEAYNRAMDGISKAVKADVDVATKAAMISQAKSLADKAWYEADIKDAESHGAWFDLGTKKRTQSNREKLVEQQLKNAILTGDLRELEKNLNKIGIQKHDSYFIRMMAQTKKGRAQLKALAESGMLPILLGLSNLPIPKLRKLRK